MNKFTKKLLAVTLVGALAITPVVMSGANNMVLAAAGGGTGTVDTPLVPSTPTGNTASEPAPYVPAPYVPAPMTDSVKTADGKSIQTTTHGLYYSSVPTAITTPQALVNAAVNVGPGERAFVTVYNSQCGPKALACVESAATAMNVEKGPMLDMFIGVNGPNGFKNVEKTAAPIRFTFGIPADFAQDGYEVAVIRVQLGGIITILPDMDTDPNTISVDTDGFGVFAFVKAPTGSFDTFR